MRDFCGKSARSAKPLHSPHLPSGDRGQKAQQCDHAPIWGSVPEARDQRGRNLIFLDGRYELGARPPPEGRRRERLAPPILPALQRAAVDGDGAAQPQQPALGKAEPHDGGNHHDRRAIHLAPQEAQRRRRCPRAAAIDRAAETEAPAVLGAESTPKRQWQATRLAGVFARVQRTPARASRRAMIVGKVAVEGEQQLVKAGIGQQG
jgi:hypothetical protein